MAKVCHAFKSQGVVCLSGRVWHVYTVVLISRNKVVFGFKPRRYDPSWNLSPHPPPPPACTKQLHYTWETRGGTCTSMTVVYSEAGHGRNTENQDSNPTRIHKRAVSYQNTKTVTKKNVTKQLQNRGGIYPHGRCTRRSRTHKKTTKTSKQTTQKQ